MPATYFFWRYWFTLFGKFLLPKIWIQWCSFFPLCYIILFSKVLRLGVLPSAFFFCNFLNCFNIFYWICYYSCPISPLHSTPSCTPPPSHIPPHSSCPWVIHISSLASTFPILFLPFPCPFSTYHLCYLFSVPLPRPPCHSPVDNPPCDLHFCGSVPVLVVCLVCFCFCFRCDC